MEQEKKNCPYCGEEILKSAKKCKHCGEWLINVPTQRNPQKQPVRKESFFGPKCRYNRIWMNALFWVTISGSFIQALNSSGIANGIVVRGSTMTKIFLGVVRFFSLIPEEIGDFLFFSGEITIIYLLMKAMSNFHKPLKELFVANIVCIAISYYFMSFVFDEDSFDSTLTSFIILLFINLFLPIMLGAQIITNYEGAIKTTGWVLIIYCIVVIMAPLLSEYVAYPIINFLMVFLPDYFYIKYLRDVLSN